jgi:glutamate synthase (ferredoxin)
MQFSELGLLPSFMTNLKGVLMQKYSGDITIVPPPDQHLDATQTSLVGNTCLYGATGGRLFVNGRGGERFAVRNSLADAVVEGVGDHCCEYMTGGTVVCLGTAGRNVAAGMTGGLGYFLDEEGDFEDRVNAEIVTVQPVRTSAGEAQLRALIQDHVDRTGSEKGQEILGNWAAMLKKFKQLVPPSEAGTPEASPEAEKMASGNGAGPAAQSAQPVATAA